MTTAYPASRPVLFSISKHALFRLIKVGRKLNELLSLSFTGSGYLKIAIAKKHLTGKRHPLHPAVTFPSGKGFLQDSPAITSTFADSGRTSSI
jgi:hypothetical protein